MKQDLNSVVSTLFLHLLNTAIWDKPIDENLFKEIDANTWEGIAKMAKQQAVSALIADKALSLPDACLPPKTIKLQFIAIIQQTEARNLKMIEILSELKQEYEEAGFLFCLLKGLGVGENYPSPLLRNSGDIDVFLYQRGDYEKSKRWINKKNIKFYESNRRHFVYTKDGVNIENHKSITSFSNKKYRTLFNKWEEDLIVKNSFISIDIHNLTVKQLPIEMNAFFIFQHLFRHFAHEGVGFRQYCDWLLFLDKYKNDIDSDSFTTLVKSYAILFPMQVFACAAVKYLGASENIFPFPMIKDDKYIDLIIEDIFNSGNFGYYQPGSKRPITKLPGLWFAYKRTVRRSIKFGDLSPEHIKMLPYRKLINRLQLGFNR